MSRRYKYHHRGYTAEDRFPHAARGVVLALTGAVSVYTLLGVIVWAITH